MARKQTLGYVELEWICPNCNSRNKGRDKTCASCGAPQPENVKFERAADEKLIAAAEAKAAVVGPDIHCGFCGTRNPGNAVTCSQCGGDLKEGQARAAGQELAAAAKPTVVTCTNCGTENPSTQTMCQKCGSPLPRAGQAAAPVSFSAPMGGTAAPSAPAKPAKKPNWLLLGGIAGVLLLCCVVGLFAFLFPSSSVQATVTDVYWQTSVPVQEQREAHYSNEQGSPPGDAYNVSCHTETTSVCEQKTIDKGNGYAEVVEECHDESTDYCSYDVKEWQTIQTYPLEGYDLFPQYASPDIFSGQRLGSASETFTVTFDSDKGVLSYNPGSAGEFQQFDFGSVWTIKLNALGGIVSVGR
ncbi:MAG: zinc ribbon domain-containing protein [Chloroflexi bacterium]|nr:zinc ribbon domain-containing protein [Chloroflexota bacterium]